MAMTTTTTRERTREREQYKHNGPTSCTNRLPKTKQTSTIIMMITDCYNEDSSRKIISHDDGGDETASVIGPSTRVEAVVGG